MTHMAPETLMEGRMSKAGDVYAFGITLWEVGVQVGLRSAGAHGAH